MDKNTIIKEIKVYLKFNKVEDLKDIPFSKIFGVKYDNLELIAFIQKNIEYIDIDSKRYYITTWNNKNALSFLTLNLSKCDVNQAE